MVDVMFWTASKPWPFAMIYPEPETLRCEARVAFQKLKGRLFMLAASREPAPYYGTAAPPPSSAPVWCFILKQHRAPQGLRRRPGCWRAAR
jgi:Zn-dependent protease